PEAGALARRARPVGDEPVELLAQPRRMRLLLAPLEERHESRKRPPDGLAPAVPLADDLDLLLAGAVEEHRPDRRRQLRERRIEREAILRRQRGERRVERRQRAEDRRR